MATLPFGAVGAIVVSLVVQDLNKEQEIVQILRLKMEEIIAMANIQTQRIVP